MTLFSSFNHLIIFLLFVYLGLISGIFFNVFCYISNVLSIKIKKGLKKPLLNKEDRKIKQEIEKTNKIKNKPKKQMQNNIFKSFVKGLNKVKNSFIILFKYIILFMFKNVPIMIFIFVVSFSYLMNLYLNFGHLRIIYVLIWLLFFFISKTLCKILANYFLSFYNYFIKRIKKNGRSKQ